MGMDVFAKKPKDDTEQSRYFRNNVWWWRPLADYCQRVAPDVCSHCEHWQSNDGDGLNDSQSLELADALQVEVEQRTLRCLRQGIRGVPSRDT